MREGDYLVGIGDQDVKWASHADVVKEIKTAQNNLKLKLVTPLDRSMAKSNYKEKVRRLVIIKSMTACLQLTRFISDASEGCQIFDGREYISNVNHKFIIRFISSSQLQSR